jgi:hypothetical protein
MQRARVPTGLAVRRAHDFCGIARRLRVLVDGREVGAVPYGQRAEFALEPGVRSVEVAMDWCRSEPYEVQVHPGELVEVEGGLRWRGLLWAWNLLAIFVCPSQVFVVRPEHAARSRAGSGEDYP